MAELRRLIVRCRGMPRGAARSAAELELGELLKKQDALILKVVGPHEVTPEEDSPRQRADPCAVGVDG